MSTDRMPVLFIGHGNPLNAISDTRYSRAWEALARTLPPPRAILVISAHWYPAETAVTSVESPRTIHDFGGFPPELFAVQYPAPGSPGLARKVQQLLAPHPVTLDTHWGLDHGAWSVLSRIFPAADVPVVQLSIDRTQPGPFHLAAGQAISPLRDEGVLIIGSGNLVHNLGLYRWNDPNGPPFDWAVRFETLVRNAIQTRDFAGLAVWEELSRDAALAVPTAEHYLPLLYTIGASHDSDRIDFPIEGIEGGSVSMLSVRAQCQV